MRKKSVVGEVGVRVKGVVSGDRMARREERRENREERRANRDERRGGMDGRRRQSDGFEDAEESSDWMFGALFVVLLVFALSPGVLLTIPPGRGGLFMSGTTSTLAAFVHAIVLVALLNIL